MSQNRLNSNSLRLAVLGQSCAASAAALAVLLGARSMGPDMANGGVGARPASPAAMATNVDPANVDSSRVHSRRIRTGEALAGLAPTLIRPASDRQIVSVILAGSPGARPGEPERLANAAAVPVTSVASRTETIDALRRLAPDVAIAACFPWRLPRAARQIPPLGILNIHPSLLPTGRGPEPLFWTLRRGERVTGVTVHRMDEGFDSGPVVAQVEMAIEPGIRAPDLEHELMALGARRLLEDLPALADGSLQPAPQSTQGVSYSPVPSPADWTMSPLLPAAWAWNFARGVAPLNGPLAVSAGGAMIPVRDALDWSPDERLAERVVEEADGTVRVRFSPGWVRFLRS